MAISSTLIGSLGASRVTESRFWFSNSRRYCSDLNKAWDIPAGRHLLFWEGTKNNGLSGTVDIDGKTFNAQGANGSIIGGYLYVEGPKTVTATGTGSAGFGEDPYMSWVKVAA